MFTKQIIDNANHFKDYLKIRKLQKATRDCYNRYYKLFKPVVEVLGLQQEVVESWLIEHKNHKQVRAFMKHYLEFLDNREIRLFRIVGRPPTKRRKVMPPEDIDEVVSYLYNHKLKYGIILAIISDAGLRRAEALAIKISDFNWKRWWDDKSKRCRLKIKGKGDKERIVTVSPVIMESIKYYADNYHIEEGFPLIKTNRSTLTKVFQDACEKLLGEKYRLHDLRKSKATQWFEEGKTLEEIRDRLGHSSVKTTEIYVSPNQIKLIDDWENE